MKASSDLNRKGTPPGPKRSPPYDGLAQGRQESLHLSFRRGNSLASYRPAQLQAGGRRTLVFPLGRPLLAPSARFGFLLPFWEEDLTIGRLKRRRTVWFLISGQLRE